MDFAKLIPAPNDYSWYNHYVSKIGEERLLEIKSYIYDLCDKLNVGDHIQLETWINHTHKKCASINNWTENDTADLFVKIIWCFYLETNMCYCFDKKFTQFKNYIEDARTLDNQSAIHNREHQNKDTRANGGRTWMQTIRTQAVSAP